MPVDPARKLTNEVPAFIVLPEPIEIPFPLTPMKPLVLSVLPPLSVICPLLWMFNPRLPLRTAFVIVMPF